MADPNVALKNSPFADSSVDVRLYKVGDSAPEDHEWKYPNVWAAQDLSGTKRLIIAPNEHHVEWILRLLDVVPEPMWLLYVLVVPRGEGEPGRYQSLDPQTREQVRRFLREFMNLLEIDGRQNLWIRSESGEGMLVYDRHNLIYVYGPLEQSAAILGATGMTEVSADAINTPDTHSHRYHAAFDSEAQRILVYMDWIRTPLREHDQQ